MTVAGGKPPTTNVLLSDDRTRMMRSARKLRAVMGTTPLLVDGPAPALHMMPLGGTSMEILLPTLGEKPSGPNHRSSKREGVVFTVSESPRSSMTSLNSTEKTHPGPLPSVAKLTLSQESRDSINSITRLRLVLTLTQPSPSAGPYQSNHFHRSTDSIDVLKRSLSVLISTPTPSAPDHAARRRKMVKLVDMLGGPIPPSLVFPPPSSTKPKSRTDRAARRRSRSVPPSATRSPAPPTVNAPRKLTRPPPVVEVVLPALSVDQISRPRALAPYAPSRTETSSPTSFGTVSTRSEKRRSRSVTPSYNLRRRGRESSSAYASES
ncbi:hypothetical protein C8R43DRAFT_968704 [Mycena crocata]|nr:hypothetical protein C8R43DRAFT_968704 [Mycena crocata]